MTRELYWKSVALGLMVWQINQSKLLYLSPRGNPPQSLDVNSTEAVWDHLDREWSKRQPTSKEALWDVLQEVWRTISEDYLKKWQEILSKRVQAVLKNKGAHTKYWLLSSLELYKLCLYSMYVHLYLHLFSTCFPGCKKKRVAQDFCTALYVKS